MEPLPIHSAIMMLIYLNLIGWALAYICRPEGRGVEVDLWKLACNNVINMAMIIVTLIHVPGLTHPVYVFSMGMLMVINPYFVTSIGEREPIEGTQKGQVYGHLIVATFVVTATVTLHYLIVDPYTYWPLAIIQLGCLASIVVTRPPALIHQQQRILIRHKKDSSDDDNAAE